MTINEIGGPVASVWEGLRPITKKMLAGALDAGRTATANSQASKYSYDARADWEVSSLLTALDERSRSSDIRDDTEKLSEINLLADTCVRILESQSASAEVFVQLAERAIKENNYDRLDKLSDQLAARYSPSEVAEVIRQTNIPQIRAIAYETLAMLSVDALISLLEDPLYAGIAATALEQKAFDFESVEARDIVDRFETESGMNGD